MPTDRGMLLALPPLAFDMPPFRSAPAPRSRSPFRTHAPKNGRALPPFRTDPARLSSPDALRSGIPLHLRPHLQNAIVFPFPDRAFLCPNRRRRSGPIRAGRNFRLPPRCFRSQPFPQAFRRVPSVFPTVPQCGKPPRNVRETVCETAFRSSMTVNDKH